MGLDDILEIPVAFVDMLFKGGWVILILIGLIGVGLYFLFFA